jgi:hypothetical protein
MHYTLGFHGEVFALSHYHAHDHSDGISSNNSSFASRRENRANHITGAFPLVGSFSIEKVQPGNFDFDQMIESLRDLFEHDRQVASQPDATRCGLCYLHFPIAELHYRDEGFYICPGCAHCLGDHGVSMLRQQQKFS